MKLKTPNQLSLTLKGDVNGVFTLKDVDNLFAIVVPVSMNGAMQEVPLSLTRVEIESCSVAWDSQRSQNIKHYQANAQCNFAISKEHVGSILSIDD